MKLSISKTVAVGAVLSAALATNAPAREPNAPFAVPVGATFGVPAGANPPPGSYLSFRAFTSPGDVVDDNNDPLPGGGVQADVKGVAAVFSLVPGAEVFGGSYRFTAIVPFVSVNQNAFGTETSDTGIGDITISPFNLSWNLGDGWFASSGIGFNLPTGAHEPDGTTGNLGAGVMSTTFNGAVSYLSKDWMLSANAFLTVNGERDEGGYTYKSAPDLLIEATAFRNFDNGFSAGGLAYLRTQFGDDECGGTAPFPCPNSAAKQMGLGIGFSKRWGPKELNVNLIAPLDTRNVREGAQLQVNYTIPLN